MPRARDLLERFRPIGAPGAAAPAGVPADRVAEAGRELAPVFAALAGAEAECARIRAEAEQEANRRRLAATEEAQRIVALARRRAEAERADAAVGVRRRAEQEAAVAQAEAERRAAAVTALAGQRLDAYVDQVVRGVRDLIEAGSADGAP
jgi:vacuolar-type H+-ATPase subunit H